VGGRKPSFNLATEMKEKNMRINRMLAHFVAGTHKRGDQFTGTEKYLLLDRDGNILFRTTFSVKAKRLDAEPVQ
jgi:hypothetical protein